MPTPVPRSNVFQKNSMTTSCGAALAALIWSAGCSSSSLQIDATPHTDDAVVGVFDAAIRDDARIEPDAMVSSGADGTATRVPCTSNFGNAMTTAHGRLDGILVAVVDPSHHGCSSDSTHVHLQIKSGGQIYDSAVNVDGGFYLLHDITLPSIPWTDGWHAGEPFDYTHLGIHSTEFQSLSQSQLVPMVESELATANHVSVYMTGYNSSGGHLVHRQGTNIDGAIVIDPLSPTSHALLFRFSTDSF